MLKIWLVSKAHLFLKIFKLLIKFIKYLNVLLKLLIITKNIFHFFKFSNITFKLIFKIIIKREHRKI